MTPTVQRTARPTRIGVAVVVGFVVVAALVALAATPGPQPEGQGVEGPDG